MSSPHFGHPQSILFYDQPERIETLVKEGILGYPCQMSFYSGNRSEVIVRLKKDPPDLLISGLVHPDGNAIDLISELKSSVKMIPSIFIGGPEQAELHNQVLKLGVFDVISYPVNIADLMKKMDRAVRVNGQGRSKTRAESFVEYSKLHEESLKLGVPVNELIDLKKNAG